MCPIASTLILPYYAGHRDQRPAHSVRWTLIISRNFPRHPLPQHSERQVYRCQSADSSLVFLTLYSLQETLGISITDGLQRQVVGSLESRPLIPTPRRVVPENRAYVRQVPGGYNQGFPTLHHPPQLRHYKIERLFPLRHPTPVNVPTHMTAQYGQYVRHTPLGISLPHQVVQPDQCQLYRVLLDVVLLFLESRLPTQPLG